jgi:hypothetical protein
MNTHPVDQYLRTLSRRQLFQRVGLGVGGLALANLLNNDLSAAPKNSFAHFAPKAKNVIYFHLVGAPSHLDLFDYKPSSRKEMGSSVPKEMFEGKQLAFIRSRPTLLGTSKESKYEFKKCGKSGIQISNLLPNLQTVADDMCFHPHPAYRAVQSCTGSDVYADRIRAVRPTQPWSVDELWDWIAQ